MAMKAMRCPQCGSDLELDDSKEFGFCSSCGTKIMLHETVEMKHSGAVQMKLDNSDQGNNRIALGNRAFAGGNYQEAYDYFTKGLEDVPNDFTALYRKGICAVCLCPEDNLRLAELMSGISAAYDILDEIYDNSEPETEEREFFYELAEQFDNDMEDLCLASLEQHKEYFYKLSNLQQANHQATVWGETAKLMEMICRSVISDELAEKLLEASISRCDEWLSHDRKGDISYYTSTTQNKKGESVDNYSVFRMSSSHKKIIEDCRSVMAEKYNNLPARVEREKEMNDALGVLQGESDALRAALDEAKNNFESAKSAFWENHPDYTARRNKQNNMTWISVGVGALSFIITLFFSTKTAVAPILGAALFAVSFFVRSKISKSLLAKLEDELFPSDVKALREAFENAQKTWFEKETERRNKQSEISAFESSKK